MRAALAMALVACGAAAQPVDPCSVYPYRLLPQCQHAGFTLFTEYDFANPGTLPSASLSTTHLAALCKVNAGGTAWTCVDKNGASLGTVTQGTGTTYQQTPFGYYAMSDLTSAKTPNLVSTALDPLFKADHTIVFAGYGTTATSATFQHYFGFNDGTNYLFARNDSGTFKCEWSGAGGFKSPSNGTLAAVDGWAVSSCRRSGNDHYSRVNGVDSVVASGSTITGNVTAGTNYYMGDRYTPNLPLRGPLAWVAIYDDDLTDAQLKTIERAFWGVDTRVAALGLGSATYCLDPDAGQVDCYLKGASMVGPRGLRTVRATTANNTFAADTLASSAGTDVGTPTITAAASAGPFFRLRNTNDCALVVDDTAAALEGKQGADGYVGNGYYTASFYLAAGTSGTTTTKARIKIDVANGGWPDAGTSHVCDITGLTSTVTRQNCTSPFFYVDAGSPTVKASYLVGNAAAETGSITVCHRQLTAGGWATVPVIDNVARGNSAYTIDPVTDSWPSTALGGKYEVVYTPVYSGASDSWDEQPDTIYLFDAHDSTPEHGVVMLPVGYNIAGRALMRTESGGSSTDFTLDGVSLTPGTMYAVSVEWTPTGATCSVAWRYNSCSGTVAACTATNLRGSTTGAVCPVQPVEVTLGNRYDSTVPTDVNISAVRVYSL